MPTPTTATTATEIDAAGGEQNVRVAVRVRPLVARERVGSSRECISEDEQSSSVSIGKRRFTFDHVFGKNQVLHGFTGNAATCQEFADSTIAILVVSQ